MTDRAPRPEGMSDVADVLESRAAAIHEWLTNDESSGIIEILHDDEHTPPAIVYEIMREAAETIRRLRTDGATLRERFAEFIAKWAHDGQKDKSGHAYIEHLMRVVNRLATPKQRVLGWLHDTLEDTMLQAPTIEAHFGADVLDAVRWLTREKDRPYANYIARMVHAAPRDVLMVKRADLLDHLREDSDFAVPDSMRDRYRFALAEIECKLANAPKEPTPHDRG